MNKKYILIIVLVIGVIAFTLFSSSTAMGAPVPIQGAAPQPQTANPPGTFSGSTLQTVAQVAGLGGAAVGVITQTLSTLGITGEAVGSAAASIAASAPALTGANVAPAILSGVATDAANTAIAAGATQAGAIEAAGAAMAPLLGVAIGLGVPLLLLGIGELFFKNDQNTAAALEIANTNFLKMWAEKKGPRFAGPGTTSGATAGGTVASGTTSSAVYNTNSPQSAGGAMPGKPGTR